MTTEELAEKIVDALRPDMQAISVNPGYDQAWAHRQLLSQGLHRQVLIAEVVEMIERSQPENGN